MHPYSCQFTLMAVEGSATSEPHGNLFTHDATSFINPPNPTVIEQAAICECHPLLLFPAQSWVPTLLGNPAPGPAASSLVANSYVATTLPPMSQGEVFEVTHISKFPS